MTFAVLSLGDCVWRFNVEAEAVRGTYHTVLNLQEP